MHLKCQINLKKLVEGQNKRTFKVEELN